MAELNLTQIEDKLNEAFQGNARILVFWYDDTAEFETEIDTLSLEHAKIYHLKPDNQFYTKYFLELEDPTTNYLIYAPFAKPPVEENHLEDMVLYSKQFHADRISLIMADLRIPENCKDTLKKHKKFFEAKTRTQKFDQLDTGQYTPQTIVIGLMSVLCKVEISSFEEVLRVVLTDSSLEENVFLEEFKKYDLIENFWEFCNDLFGYYDASPSLEKLMITFFVTTTQKSFQGKVPSNWENFISYKSGNIIVFMNNLMNNELYHDRYDELSDDVSQKLNLSSTLETCPISAMIQCDTFTIFDDYILRWITEQLLKKEQDTLVEGYTIKDICKIRLKKHFGTKYQKEYSMLKSATYLLSLTNYSVPEDFSAILKQYQTKDYLFDNHYRHFYYYYDNLQNQSPYEALQELIENLYVNVYLNTLLPQWNQTFSSNQQQIENFISLQYNFYQQHVKPIKDKLVVIISDAMRYEVGMSLFQELEQDEKFKPNFASLLSVLPSYTSLGMAALLPHQTLELTDDYVVKLDGKSTQSTLDREKILQSYSENSRAVTFKELTILKQNELRDVFNGMDVVYVYHDQIDARGDKRPTEDEVFVACKEAISEISQMMKRLANSANISHFMITADHGFLYRKNKLSASDKIDVSNLTNEKISKRYILSSHPIQMDGVMSYELDTILGTNCHQIVSVPLNYQIFTSSGGGNNFVHGGCSPQEMIIPLLDVKTERGHVPTTNVTIDLVSMVQKVTSLIISLDFIQLEPISDVVKPTNYKLYFISEQGEKISNECIYHADSKKSHSQDRIFRLRFDLKNKKYSINENYYLVAYDMLSNVELFRKLITIDVAFANDFGFNI